MLESEVPFMKSQNFEFLRAKRAVLADLAGFAEKYVHSDPASSLIKQRGFVEQIVTAIYETYRLRPPFSDNLNDLMNAEPFRQSVPEVVQNKLHAVRKSGNHAAHPRRPITSDLSLDCLYQLFDIARWFHIQIDGGAETPTYAAPAADVATNGKAKEALEQLRLAEAKYESVLAALEDETKKRLEAERAAEQHETELGKLKEEGQKVASILQFNEQTTRSRLIDRMLADAGWDVGLRGVTTQEVGQEIQLFMMPTESGEGYADYVLYGDDGKPLAVVEAKKTSKDPRVGREQARIYAECLLKETGQRPVIFYTNGVDTWIWDDAQNYPPRKIYGIYSKDSLEYLLHQRNNKRALASVDLNPTIAERAYQHEAIRRVCDRFTANGRKALLVLATGTGKTRIAVSLVDLLMRAGWVKRVLFLCDRRELRRQADNTFKEFLPGEPRIVVGTTTSSDRDKRIYLATYQAMDKCYETFDVGFFDLIIADESHRSIYNAYRSIFQYFDAFEVGLTATPKGFVNFNTYRLFDCGDQDPTAHYSYQEAVSSSPPYLVPFRVRNCKTWARTDGFSYRDMSEEQRKQLEDQVQNAPSVDHDADEIDVTFFNKDTTRFVWSTLMTEGIREGTGSRVGKTIVFARSHAHALHLEEVFHEMYPQYGGAFCRVIDNQEPKAEQLIDDFKNRDNPLTIAISVDMLDTGVDVPGVVNLVFVKPLKSYVKFWQMIGRGTRLCRDLFGPGDDKKEFLIFDHCSNFEAFDQGFQEKQPSKQKSLLQQLFETRIELAEAAVQKFDTATLQAVAELLVLDLRALIDSRAIDVRNQRQALEVLAKRDRIVQFDAPTVADLQRIAAPLMQWRDVRGEVAAYRLDLIATRLQAELVRSGATAPRFLDLKARLQNEVALLLRNQNPVKAKAATIQKVESREFWSTVTPADLDDVRRELRGIMQYQRQAVRQPVALAEYDVADRDKAAEDYVPVLEGIALVTYRLRVEEVLKKHFETNPTLHRVRAGKPVREEELEELARLVLEVDDQANVKYLSGHDPQTRRSLLTVFRGLVGLEPAAVEAAFQDFVTKHPRLSAQQLRFLQVLQNYIAQNGGIELERLYEPPFTTVHAESVDGVFTAPGEVDEILAILSAFEPKKAMPSDPPPNSQQAS
ncbi:MAG: DEAD/DEAH box helicase family protein [Myxococcales bacterium]|nr:DEAD/DEAH box helicase family protein [Myxococcales bacterium]